MILRVGPAAAAIAVACAVGGCSHEQKVVCEPAGRYVTAATAGPVRIPDDLNPPDETDSLRLPPDPGPATARSKPCLESPPGYYADGAPGAGRGGAAGGRSAPGTAPRPAAPPPAAAPAAPPRQPAAPQAAADAPSPAESPPATPPAAESAPPGGDREISN